MDIYGSFWISINLSTSIHDCGPFVFIATNTTLLSLPLSVAVSHIGCPERKIGSAASYPIADRAAVSILSVVGLSHRTLFITSRASFLSACHRHSHHLEPQIIWIKCYLVGRVQQRSQPLSERFLELVVLHTLRHSIAQSKKIMCPNYARSHLSNPSSSENDAEADADGAARSLDCAADGAEDGEADGATRSLDCAADGAADGGATLDEEMVSEWLPGYG